MSCSSVPDLTVIIASYNSENTIVACLESLRRQKTKNRFEIILIDSSVDNTVRLAQMEFPGIKVYSFDERKYCGDARNFGMTMARADIIAFLDSDCTVDDNWVNEIMNAHKTDYLTVGGSIENGDPKDLVSWAYYFCEFNLWLPFKEKREIPEMAGCCLSIKRHAFDTYGPFIEGTYSSDTAFQWKLQNDNHKVLCLPTIKVYHTANYKFRDFLSHIFTHRQQYAKMLVSEKKISNFGRTAMIFGFPVLPIILFLVILIRVLRSGRFQFEFLCSSPLIFAGVFSRAYGEFTGFIESSI